MTAHVDPPAGVLDWLLLAAVLAPLVGGAVIGMLAEHRYRLRNAIALLTTGAVAVVALVLGRAVLQGAPPAVTAWRVSPLLYMGFAVDRLGVLFSVTASVLWTATVIYSWGYLGRSPNQRRYFAFLTASLGAAMGVAWAGNLFTMYAFYELLSFSTYALVVHEGGRAAARAGRIYIAYSLTGASLVLLGITGTLVAGGSLEFVPGGLLSAMGGGAGAGLGAGVGAGAGPAVYGIALCLLAGFGVKGALMPLHGWLPQAMVAPTPISGLLHAVAVVKSGVFSITRALYWVLGSGLLARTGINNALALAAAVSILLASIAALRQDVLKRRLAYSTVSMLAYISLGAATLNAAGITGGLLHLVMHAAMKITLFLAAGIIINRTGRTRVSELDGIGRVLPWTMAAFAVASAGMVGIPPLAGFVSKWYLLQGVLGAWGYGAVAVLLVSSLLNAAYLFPVVTRAYLGTWKPSVAGAEEHGHAHGHGDAAGETALDTHHGAPGGDPSAPGGDPSAALAPDAAAARTGRRPPEAPWSMLAPVLLLALLCVVLGLWPGSPLATITGLLGGMLGAGAAGP